MCIVKLGTFLSEAGAGGGGVCESFKCPKFTVSFPVELKHNEVRW